MGKRAYIFSFILIFSFLLLFIDANPILAQRFVTQEQGACLHIEKGEIDEAVDILQKILKSRPDDLNARLYLGIAYYMKKELERSYQEFEKIEKEVDKMLGSSRPFGDEAMFTELGMDRKRDNLFSKEREGLLYFCRGLTLKGKKDFKNAEKRFKKALKLKYDEKAVRLQLIDLYLEKKDMKAVSKEFAELKRTAGDTESLAFLEGYVKFRKGSVEEALTAFEKIAPSNLGAKKNVALIHYNKSDFQQSVEVWEEILAEYPDDKEAQINVGRAYYHLGNSEEAQDYFTKAGIKLPPEKFSPKKVPLSYGTLVKEVKFDLLCGAK